jgi:hypothetical protein
VGLLIGNKTAFNKGVLGEDYTESQIRVVEEWEFEEMEAVMDV